MIDHVNIVVRDIEISVEFYSRVLGLRRGFERVLQGEWIDRVSGLSGVRAKCVFMESVDGGARLELLQYENPAGLDLQNHGAPNALGVRHVAWTVGNLEETLERLREFGAEIVSLPVDVPFAVGNLGRKKLCYFYDPDGVLLEIAAYEAV